MANMSPQQREFYRSTRTGKTDDFINRDRDLAVEGYDELDTDLYNYGAGAGQDQARYEQQADSIYDPMIRGEGGYQDASALQYSNPEVDAIKGDPWAGSQFFDPTRERGDFNQGQQEQQTALATGEQEYANAYDPANIRSSGQYASDVYDALDTNDSAVDAAVDPNRLRLSEDFADRYEMSPEAQQRMVTAAGQDVNDLYQADLDRFGRQAAAAGTSVLGQGALRMRGQRDAAVKSADAMTRARIQADEAAADRMARGEQMRLDAERGYSDRAVGAADQKTRTRLSGMGDVEGRRMAGEETVAGLNSRRAEFNANNRNATARNLATDRTNFNRDMTDRGLEIHRRADETSSGRAKTVADTRIGASKTTQDATRADAAEGRGYVTGQIGANRADRQFSMGQRTNLYGTANNAVQNTTRSKLTQDGIKASKPSIWDRLAGGAATAASML